MNARPAEVQRAGVGRYVVVGVAVGDLPMVAPTVRMTIRRVKRVASPTLWELEIGGRGGRASHHDSLRSARYEASKRAWALGEVPEPPADTSLVDSTHERWPERLRAYVAGAFAGAHRAASSVEYVADQELWRVTTSSGVWEMRIGSDDDEFLFHLVGQPEVVGCDRYVSFPIPELL